MNAPDIKIFKKSSKNIEKDQFPIYALSKSLECSNHRPISQDVWTWAPGAAGVRSGTRALGYRVGWGIYFDLWFIHLSSPEQESYSEGETDRSARTGGYETLKGSEIKRLLFSFFRDQEGEGRGLLGTLQ